LLNLFPFLPPCSKKEFFLYIKIGIRVYILDYTLLYIAFDWQVVVDNSWVVAAEIGDNINPI